MRTIAISTVIAASLVAAEANADELSAVATFSVLGDMVSRVGGDRVRVTTLVGPGGDAHVYKATPQDAQAIRQADVLFVNGLSFEGWLDRLIDASGYDGQIVVATAQVDARRFDGGHDHGEEDHAHADAHDHGEAAHAHADEHDHGEEDHAHADEHDHGEADHAHAEEGHDHGDDEHAHGDAHDHAAGTYDPHAWLSLTAAKQYVREIEDGLAAADPGGADVFAANARAYIAEIDALENTLEAAIAGIPEESRTVVISHDSFGYFEAEYGIEFLSPQGVSTEAEASARDVARLIRQIREEGIDAVFLETITDNRLVEMIAKETGAAIGGDLYTGALSGPDGPAPTYLHMMRHNIEALTTALGTS